LLHCSDRDRRANPAPQRASVIKRIKAKVEAEVKVKVEVKVEAKG